MKYLYSILVVSLLVGCGPKLPPNLQKIQNKDNLVNALGILQDAVIGAESQKKLSTDDTRIIVTFTNTALKTIRDAGLGFKNDLIKQLDELKKNSTLVGKYSSSIDLIESLIRLL